MTDLTARVAELAALIEANLAEDEAAADELHNRIECNLGQLQVFGECSCGYPARVLRRVKAARDLVTVILAEAHADSERDSPYSCARILAPGKACDCGRDARVARLLGIIASEWEG